MMATANANSVRKQVWLPKQLDELIEKAAEKTGASWSDQVRHALAVTHGYKGPSPVLPSLEGNFNRPAQRPTKRKSS